MQNNPFAMQYKSVKTEDEKVEKNTKNNTKRNTNKNVKSNTQGTSIVKTRALRQSFSVKLDKEISDKMISYCIENDLKFTDLIEHCLGEFFNKNNIEINEEIVEEYYENRSRKKKEL